MRKYHVWFGGGRLEKEPQGHLVSRLPNSIEKGEDTMSTFEVPYEEPQWPEPTVEEPDLETLIEWMEEGMCEATDACIVEADGTCPHGHRSWLLHLGLI